jgi:hypothetical protein
MTTDAPPLTLVAAPGTAARILLGTLAKEIGLQDFTALLKFDCRALRWSQHSRGLTLCFLMGDELKAQTLQAQLARHWNKLKPLFEREGVPLFNLTAQKI